MFMKKLLFYLLLFSSITSFAQTSNLSGTVLGDNKEALGYATIALLNPIDSTLLAFGITNDQGQFKVRQIVNGSYIMQIAYLGHKTYYRKLDVPVSNNGEMGVIIMEAAAINLPSVEVEAEYIPIKINKDTIEYNALAFKTKPDASTEDLLRKLPGIEVDRAGNIKAVGEDVDKVLVEGKEFFSSDSKVATKNLPADAIKKVQVFDKGSDESELSGIDDGSKDKTINLILKDDKKKAWFGDVKAGYGTDNHYMANANVYRFSSTHQFASLAMINNTNKFGFSFQDYIDFNGGIQTMFSGGTITLTNDNSVPVDYGQTVTGLVTSGGGGINYSFEKKKDNRFYVSYLGNGYEKFLTEDSDSKNFTPQGSFFQTEHLNQNEFIHTHPVNFGWKNKSDSVQHFILTGGATLSQSNISGLQTRSNLSNDTIINMLEDRRKDKSQKLNSNIYSSWLRKGKGKMKLLKMSVNASGANSINKKDIRNFTEYFTPSSVIYTSLFQDNLSDVYNVKINASSLLQIGRKFYLEPEIASGLTWENLTRIQGESGDAEIVTDSLSPQLLRSYNYLRPGIYLKRNNDKINLILGSGIEIGKLKNSIQESEISENIFYLLPEFSFEYKYKTGNRFSLFYNSNVVTPVASQLLPIVSNLNPLTLYYGNRNLKPEYHHNTALQWFMFDQFSGISVFAGVNAEYTKYKISWSREIDENLNQVFRLTNVPYDYYLQSMADFSTPIRKLKIKIALGLRESLNQSISYINGIENVNVGIRHKIKLSVENFKKDKWDIMTGASFEINETRYSINQTMDYRYNNFSYFGEIRYSPSDRWHFLVSADVINYDARNFNSAISVPLLNAEVNFNFLKNNRGMLSIECYDILNKNIGITRTASENYLMETRTNIIGRYFLLSFKYRLSKFKRDSGISISI